MNFLKSLITRAVNAISPSKSIPKKATSSPESPLHSTPPSIPPPFFDITPPPQCKLSTPSPKSEDSPRVSKIAAKAAAAKKQHKPAIDPSPPIDSETSLPNTKKPRRTAKKDPEPRPVKKAKIDLKGNVAAKPTTAKRPPAKRCQICSKVLKAGNFFPLPDHSECLVCFSCLKTQNHINLLCPVCKSGYSKKSKEILEWKVPGLMNMLSENKLKDSAFKCDTCGVDTELSTRHECAEGKVRCMACHEYLIATKCYRKKCICPKCKAVPHEVYISCARRSCSKCGEEVNLNQIAHWCEGRQYLVCEECKPECGCRSLESTKVARQ